MEEEGGDEGLGFGVVGVEAVGEEEEGEPERWAFHEEPGEGGREVGPPAGPVVLAVRGLEEGEGEEGGGCDEEEREEGVVEERCVVLDHHGCNESEI